MIWEQEAHMGSYGPSSHSLLGSFENYDIAREESLPVSYTRKRMAFRYTSITSSVTLQVAMLL
jgi:hypothetical protein